MRLSDALPGLTFDPSPLARVTPGTLPPLARIQAPAAVVQGVAYVPVPGARGLPGDVAGTLPWAQVTGQPSDLIYGANLTALRAELRAQQTYVQPFSAAPVVVVTHNLGRYPGVTVLDSAGTEWEAEVRHDSAMQLTVLMSALFSGRVICN